MTHDQLYDLLTLLQSFGAEHEHDTEYLERCVNDEIDRIEGDALETDVELLSQSRDAYDQEWERAMNGSIGDAIASYRVRAGG